MKQTYIVDISEIEQTWLNFEKRTRGVIRKCPQKVYKSEDLETFDDWHKKTRPDRWITSGQIFNLYDSLENKCMYATETAMALISWDKEMGYYLMACRDKDQPNDGSPSKILWQAMKDLNKKGLEQFDLCGANTPSITFFKRGFGGKLVPQTKQYININEED